MKRKIGIVIGYNGSNYHGLQHNKQIRTIELEIINGLLAINAIKQENAVDPKKIGLQRTSRTDKGVHAAMSLLTCKVEIEIQNEIKEEFAKHLAKNNIHLYKIARLPNGFAPKKKCHQRHYEYVLPTFIFDEKFTKTYRITNEQQEELYKIFQNFVGTKNHHNFTTTANTKGTTRCISKINVTKPYINNEIEYVKVKILGNSFMINQIRKMIGFVVTIQKFAKNKETELFKAVFTETKYNIPKAPAEFLFLDHPRFDFYDKTAKYEKIEVSENEIDDVKKVLVYPEIHKLENLQIFENWFDIFTKHRYEFDYLQ
ncbi:tRNA pseudouridine synthase 1 [Binucleata daphniae]